MTQPEEEQDPNTLIDAIATVLRPGGWLSGPCPDPVDDEDES